MNLPQLPADKANHALYGALVACAVAVPYGPYWALLAACALGALKEVSDWWQNRKGGSHGIEIGDALATAAGGALCCIPILMR